MSEFKGTPGPWRVARASEYAGAELNVDAAQRGYVCAAGARGDDEAEANARLIAAAPDLLEALIELKEHGMSWDERYDKIIAKATEQS